jgi:phosphopantothenate-cysteine ligase
MENGYAVIFLHRQFSLLPYSRHYSHTNSFLDYMVETKDGKSVTVDEKYQVQMLQILKQYHYAKQNNLILLIPFTTVNQYLFTLRMISFQLSEQVNISSRCMHLFYLAAAVSDFFIPISRISEHKIQSQEEHGGANGGKLIIDLDPVPKFLKRLVSSWVPGAMIVSFKLETDNSILLKKASSALKRYNHQLVIGNLLQTRKHQVIFVTPSNVTEYNLSKKQDQEGLDVEGVIVPEVINLHSDWIKQAESH